MARFMVGTGGFEYKYDIGGRSIDLSLLAAGSGVGTLMFALEYLVTFETGASEELSFRELAERRGLERSSESEPYEGPQGEDPQTSFERACAAEQASVPALLSLFGDRVPVRIELRARAQFRFFSTEWDRMIEWLNGFLPSTLKLTLERLQAFDLVALKKFDPNEDSPGDVAAGTQHAAFLYAANADRYLPYLGLRIVTHAVQHKIETMSVEETDRLWRGTLWKAS
jgi:hypothetical protein